ncbi:MAG: hydrogenase maturation nickel metallochaperone HypA [Hydrogenophilales bacterium CG03_land_8_20_14_0_80_62_28]|nr:hydrogenase maturation nickel metallochaperone HypA [Betaproteobacteria bacterium]OIO78443.1 MAG: hydrogenase maturation nickel metallochaperone HypA [Hydrogenophilaceae bacterium CG1_02_62_390]PIV22051.1 MAG: hydrogenase maturation nickel metallochaperone HypA [Hydrogenophilales bacterium CG03_land_8_20_14_0_80_62_28]PIW37958.1 MAG: hydrogenase maturation nickel metallochaperone HypA [Hydrogenophilales bacterium CG15_BIG_FIL_POST_REV_8_21_14_020_62_31]PIW72755.1 MAG: hydrogenase maturation 
MHELSVAQALVEQVEDLASQHGATGVYLIRVRIGPLAGIEPELLAVAFPLAAAGTRAEQARLDLVMAPVRVRCQTCSAEGEAQPNNLVCGACGDWRTRIVSGDEMILETVELDIPEPIVS